MNNMSAVAALNILDARQSAGHNEVGTWSRAAAARSHGHIDRVIGYVALATAEDAYRAYAAHANRTTREALDAKSAAAAAVRAYAETAGCDPVEAALGIATSS